LEKDILEKETDAHQQTRVPMNAWKLLVSVLTSPRQTFEDIVAHPHFAAGLTALCTLNLLITLLILPKVKAFTIWAFEQQAVQMPPGAAVAKEMAATVAMVAAAFAAVAGPIFFSLLMAVLLFFFGYLVQNRAPFRTLFAVSVFAYVPATIASIVQSALIAFRPAENLKGVTTSLAMFLPEGAEGLLHRILSLIDPLGLWTLALVALGGAVAYKTGFCKAAVYLLILWVIYIAANAAIQSFLPGGAGGI
jgi:hypothetical protein